ncbi:MAG: hypothetical protein R2695_17025 [Acidimicrobiales bacterium]
MVGRHPKHGALRTDVERILKQRSALLRSTHGRLDADAAFTLEVWDTKLAIASAALRGAREGLLASSCPVSARPTTPWPAPRRMSMPRTSRRGTAIWRQPWRTAVPPMFVRE